MRSLKITTIISFIIVLLVFAWNNLFITKEDRKVTAFNSIFTSGPVNVFIKQSNKESLTVRADTHLHDKIITEVVNGKLKIYIKGRVQGERVIDVYVSYLSIDSIHGSSQSTLTGRSIITSKKLLIKASGASEIKLQTKVDSLNLIMNNYANVQLAGTATNFNLLITDGGDLVAYNLASQFCSVHVNTGDQSPGIARINVEKTLDATIVGPRHVKYKGNPTITHKSIVGDGKLIKL